MKQGLNDRACQKEGCNLSGRKPSVTNQGEVIRSETKELYVCDCVRGTSLANMSYLACGTDNLNVLDDSSSWTGEYSTVKPSNRNWKSKGVKASGNEYQPMMPTVMVKPTYKHVNAIQIQIHKQSTPIHVAVTSL